MKLFRVELREGEHGPIVDYVCAETSMMALATTLHKLPMLDPRALAVRVEACPQPREGE